MGRHQDNAINIAFHQRLHQPVLQLSILAAYGQQRHGPAAGQGVLEAGSELGKIRVRDVGQHYADGVPVLRTQ